MAVRPAPRRAPGGGLTGLHYGLIAFVIVSVASLGGFIWQLTTVKKVEDEANRFKRQLADYGSPPSYYSDEAQNRKTSVFTVMDEDRKGLAKLVTGSADAVGKTVEADSSAMLKQVDSNHPKVINPNDTLLTVVRKLDKALAAATRERTERGQQVETLQAENQTLNESIKAVKDDFQAQVAAVNDQVSKVQAALAKYQEERDTQLTSIQAAADKGGQEMDQFRQAALRERKNLELEVAKLATQNETLKKSIEATNKPGFDPNDILTKADGRVVRAIPGSEVVYINLGESDNLKLGMSFEVFSPTRESADRLRGKASLEVVSVQPSTAECRVTRSEPGRPIIENDFVVNISYERNRKPKFVVAGSFDLNYDGLEDQDGVEKIKSMIAEWGGQSVTDLDETVDFVIIGARPRVPTTAGGKEKTTEVVGAQVRAKEEKLTEFSELVTEARAMFIPVINQNQFLFLTGYAGEMRLSAVR